MKNEVLSMRFRVREEEIWNYPEYQVIQYDEPPKPGRSANYKLRWKPFKAGRYRVKFEAPDLALDFLHVLLDNNEEGAERLIIHMQKKIKELNA